MHKENGEQKHLVMLCRIASCILLSLIAFDLFAQCSPGIPGAGSPGCIPPTVANSPYYQGGNNDAPVSRWAGVNCTRRCRASGRENNR